MNWYVVKGYWKHPDLNGLYNVDDFGNAFRVKRWEVLGRNFCSNYIK